MKSGVPGKWDFSPGELLAGRLLGSCSGGALANPLKDCFWRDARSLNLSYLSISFWEFGKSFVARSSTCSE